MGKKTIAEAEKESKPLALTNGETTEEKNDDEETKPKEGPMKKPAGKGTPASKAKAKAQSKAKAKAKAKSKSSGSKDSKEKGNKKKEDENKKKEEKTNPGQQVNGVLCFFVGFPFCVRPLLELGLLLFLGLLLCLGLFFWYRITFSQT